MSNMFERVNVWVFLKTGTLVACRLEDENSVCYCIVRKLQFPYSVPTVFESE